MSTTLQPLSLIYNQKSGFHATQQEGVYEELLHVLSQHGFEIQLFEMGEIANFDQLMQQVLARHQAAQLSGVVVAAGGDGTLNAVAAKLKGTSIPMGILPLGTFNYVARLLNIPLDLIEAAHVIATGSTRAVHVAQINQHIYLNNASLGLYPLFIQKRERYNQYLGRLPLHAYTSGLDVLIRDRKELKLKIAVDGKLYPLKTPLIFFGNNQLQLSELNLRIAQAAEQGKVAGVVVAKSDKLTLFKILWQMIQGKLDQASDIYSFAADQVVIHSTQTQLTVAIDGEIVKMRPPLHISVQKNALNIKVPHAVASV
ncbi:diacylglycerol/lipid kinase family protein [Acinetobacter towneri]|uniref:diacylglycerol/lipid kinase family protein n=1 Tax=Acinetobacter towneri TaxID=202956 RepID=UPI003213D4C9